MDPVAVGQGPERALRAALAASRVILNTNDERALIREVAAVLVREGGFRAACIRLEEHAHGPALAAHAGEEVCFTRCGTETGARLPPCASLLPGGECSRSAVVHRGCCEVCPLADDSGSEVLVGTLGSARAGLLAVAAHPGTAVEDEEATILADLARDLTRGLTRLPLDAGVLAQHRRETLAWLAGGIAHSLNNALAVVRSCAEMIAEDRHDDSELQDDLLDLVCAARVAGCTASQLLTLAGNRPGSPRLVELDQLVAEVEPVIERLLGDSIAFDVHRQAGRASVWVDPRQLEQVLLSLALNARDAMPRGGALQLATHLRPAGPATGQPRGAPVGSWVLLELHDSGPGMDRAILERCFEPFYSTKPNGLGLGLSCARDVVEHCGGCLEARCAPGGGCTMAVWLPQAPYGAPGSALAADQ